MGLEGRGLYFMLLHQASKRSFVTNFEFCSFFHFMLLHQASKRSFVTNFLAFRSARLQAQRDTLAFVALDQTLAFIAYS